MQRVQLGMLNIRNDLPGGNTPAEDVEAGAEFMGACEKVEAAGTQSQFIVHRQATPSMHGLPSSAIASLNLTKADMSP